MSCAALVNGINTMLRKLWDLIPFFLLFLIGGALIGGALDHGNLKFFTISLLTTVAAMVVYIPVDSKFKSLAKNTF